MKKAGGVWLVIGLVAGVGVGLWLGWFQPWRGSGGDLDPGRGLAAGGRRVRFYQSPMHPWITSPEPGLCTICGMKLVPVHEGEAGFETQEGVLRLGSNSVTALGIASVPVVLGQVRRELRLAGTLDDDDSRHRIVSARVEGRLESFRVGSEGVEIREGDELAVLYSPALLAAVREYVVLARNGGGGPLVSGAALRLQQMGLTAGQVSALASGFREDTQVLPWLSPMSGTVVRRMAYAGQWVREGDALLEVADFDIMWLKLDAYERDLGWVRPGQEVVWRTPALPGQWFTNRVSFVDPNLDRMTRSAVVRVEVSNADPGDGHGRRFRHRVYAEAGVRVESGPVRVVPRTAVLNPGGQARVWVDHGEGQYENRVVQVGRAGDTSWEIVDGLVEGERVVLMPGVLGGSGEPPTTTPVSTAPTSAGQTGSSPGSVPGGLSWIPVTGDGALAEGMLDAARVLAELAASLAADDVGAYNRSLAAWAGVVGRLSEAGSPVPSVLLNRLGPAEDLGGARQALHGVLSVWMPVMERLRGWKGVEGLRLYRCPMTRTAFPGAPAEAGWWQFGGPLRNPWFGREMLECGKEVR